MSWEEYPLVYAYLLEKCKTWLFASKWTCLEDNVQDMMGKTPWGILRLMNELLSTPQAPEKKDCNITARRCPFNPNIGCNNGCTGVLEEFFHEDSQGTVFRESGVMCAAWGNTSKACMRIWADYRKEQ